MKKDSTGTRRFVGLDVHAETIAVGAAEDHGEVRSIGTIPNRPESVKRLAKKPSAEGPWKACYEAGPTGNSHLRRIVVEAAWSQRYPAILSRA